jgi:hypothetical protein
MLIVMSACGSQATSAPQEVDGPALLFFYTDN